jgi:hypothetical protein
MIRAEVASSWINAWTLHRACAALGVDLRSRDPRPELPLPTAVADGGQSADWLFHTDEASLRQALSRWPISETGADAVVDVADVAEVAAATAEPTASPRFWPRRFPAGLLDDKQAFADWLAADPDGPQGLPQWPLPAAGMPDLRDGDPRFPLLLKARHSWVDGVKLPRGWVCRDAAELDRRHAELPALGLRGEWFFLQTWLGDQTMRLLSVGGFFDARRPARNLACVTDRVADYGDGPSSSAMLVTVEDRFGLIALSERVLARLDYCGPYEMEFIVTGDGRVHLLELNPRFWMQHGLFLAAGNTLVRRYLGLDLAGANPAADAPPGQLLWVDGTWLLRRLLDKDRHAIGLLWHWAARKGYRVVCCPGLAYAARAAVWRLLRRRQKAGSRGPLVSSCADSAPSRIRPR